MKLSEELRRLLADTRLKLHSSDFFIVSLDSSKHKVESLLEGASPFYSLTYTTDEISLVIKRDEWEGNRDRYTGSKYEGPYKVITLDIVLDLSVVGYLAVISQLLADRGISIYALSTYLKDHILVKKEDRDEAVRVIEGLIESTGRSDI
ncbi:MAG: ACT domain-containing protein [Candidatus Bathyarchaeia archaeon]